MSTNYYLAFGVCKTCGKADSKIHIGKYSNGWVFLFQKHDKPCFHSNRLPPMPLPEEIVKLTREITKETGKTCMIQDEYEKEVKAKEFLLLIELSYKAGKRHEGRGDFLFPSNHYEHANGYDYLGGEWE